MKDKAVVESDKQKGAPLSQPKGAAGHALIVAGGGTGGHLFPGIAVAEEFLSRAQGNRVLFIGTRRGVEKDILPALGYPLVLLDVEGIKGRGGVKAALALAKVPAALLESRRIIAGFGPHLVLGVGGYASGPAVLAAHLMGIATAVAEQNALPGLTNRILGRFARRIFVTFAESRRFFPQDRTFVTGNPVRAAFLDREDSRREGPFTILVFGGSQGAHAINSAVSEALDLLFPLREKIRFIHQTGEKDCPAVRKAYADRGFQAEVLPFIKDMAAAYAKADLLVCRAGATTLAEITAAGKASILIPFPHAVADHQTRNAEVLSRAGAARLIREKELTAQGLAEAIIELASAPKKIRQMEEAAANLGNRDAAKKIVDLCLELVEGRVRHEHGRQAL